MKLKYIFIALVSSLALFTACEKEEPTSLSDISLDRTYVSIPAGGGDANVVVTSTQPWAFVKAVVVGQDADKKDIYGELPTWLTANTVSGPAGETKVVFHADAIDGGREQELQISCGDHTQYLIVRQGSLAAVKATCAEVLAGAEGKTYTVTGVCTSIANTNYGNWYIKDDTGEVYVYGTVDADGKYNWASFNIEVGDIVTVQGPKKNYVGSDGSVTIELVDVSVIKVVKALLSVDVSKKNFQIEGGEFVAKAAYKGNGVFVNTPDDWAQLVSMDYVSGVPTKIEPHPADTAVITFRVLPNVGEARESEITLSSASGDQTTVATIAVTQASALGPKTLYEITFLEGKGEWTTTDVVPVEGVASIWTESTEYGMIAKATKKADSKAELVSPTIDLTSVTAAFLSFQHVQRFTNSTPSKYLKLFVSPDNGEKWTEVLIPTYSSGSNWTYVDSGEISLKPFVGKQIKIKFEYTSDMVNYATWEIKNLKVIGADAAIASIAALNNATISSETTWTGTFKDAVVTYVNGSNAFIQDATGGNLLYKNGHGLKAGQVINGEVSGKVKLYNGFSEMTDLDLSKATVTDGEAPAPTKMTLSDLLKCYLRFQNCQVLLEGVTFDTPITPSVRSGMISQAGSSIAAYAQIKNTLDMSGTGNLVCWPSRFNATLQVGVWDNAHFTK